ncbi:transcription termination factor 1-like [Halichoeres trimaculatus]|uniref:transcription termination factor 1-like n=1 Tax=Halichoeres trimaculatus TaxID=147232 RepID=UPI003D9DB1C4
MNSPASDAYMSSKKKKKKKHREQEEEQLHVLPDDSLNDSEKKKQKQILCEESNNTETAHQQGEEGDSVLMEITTGKKKKKKKKTQEQDEEEIQNVPEGSVKETADQHAGETDSGLSSGGNSVKKKKKKRHMQGEEETDIVPEESGAETKKKKIKQTLCEESVDTETANQHGGEGDSVLLGMKKKKKKKKRKEEEELHAEEEDTVNEDPAVLAQTDNAKKKKKKKRKLVEEEEEMHATEEDSTIKSITETNSAKKKKRRTQEQEDEEIHAVEENSVIEELIETTDNHAGDTNPAVLAKTNSVRKKKKERKGDVEVEEVHAVEHQNNTNSSASVRTQVGLKRKQTKGAQKRTGPRDSPADDVFDSKVLDEMEEFLPDIRKFNDEKISRLLRLDLPRFREFKKEGIPVRKGKFTEEENQQIRKNMADFQALIGIDSVEKVVFPERFKEEEVEIKRLRKHHHYVERIAEGIPRICDHVNTRVRKLFDERNRMGKFSDEEVQTLVKLQNRHGNDWKRISEIMGRSIYSLEKRFSTCTQGHGAWNDDEVSRLKGALKDHLKDLLQQNPESSGLTRDQLCENLPWTVISQKVKTRQWSQCRLKWFSLLKTKLSTSGNSTFKRGAKACQAKIQLINTLYNMNVDDQADVDWHEVAKAIGNSTPVCVQKSFLRLKKTRVPHWPCLSFGEVVDFLYEVVVPVMEEEMPRAKKEDEEHQGEELQERMYQLSDIFDSQDEEEFEDLDNS